jgi:hypothetical protein
MFLLCTVWLGCDHMGCDVLCRVLRMHFLHFDSYLLLVLACYLKLMV